MFLVEQPGVRPRDAEAIAQRPHGVDARFPAACAQTRRTLARGHGNVDGRRATLPDWTMVRNIVHSSRQERPVQIRLIAADPESQPTNSPTLYKTDRGSWIVQGWVVTDSEVLTQMGIPEGEACVEIPDRMTPFFAEGD
jgi:hypothetical protein